jgi:hypothetical protein
MGAMRHLLATAALLLTIPVIGCGDNKMVDSTVDSAVIDAPMIDSTPIDAPPPPVDANCPALAPGAIGGPCTLDTQCDSASGAADGFCLRGMQGSVMWPAAGYCVLQTECTTDVSCGAGNRCVTINDPGGAFKACLPACGTGACACSNGQICATSYVGSPLNPGQTACLPGDNTAHDGDSCTQFADCFQDSLCLSDAFETPGGQCGRVGCTLGTDLTCATGGDGHCVDLAQITTGQNSGTVCVDRCTTNTDCRGAEGYKCFDGGGTIGKYCRHPQAGDACAAAADCGDIAIWDCKAGATFPGGMCTLRTACPTPGSLGGCSPLSSICYDSVLPAVPTDNVCVDRCGGPMNTLGGCRTGYICRDVDPLPGANHIFLGCVAP